MRLTSLKLGEQVELSVERGENIFTLNTKIQEVEEDYLFLSTPSLNGSHFLFTQRDKVYLVARADKILYRWVIADIIQINTGILSLIKIVPSGEGEIYNRREAFRVQVDVSCLASQPSDVERFSISLKNISYVGVGFTTKEELSVGDIVEFVLEDEDFDIPLTIQIVRKDYRLSRNGVNYYGASIIVSTGNLSRYVNKVQLELIRKERKLKYT